MAILCYTKAGIATQQIDLDEPMHKVAVSGFSIAVFLTVFAVAFQ